MSLDFYLIHGMFVEMFGYNFLDLAKSIVYIRNVPIYIVAVLSCSVPATALFNLIRKKITGLALGKRRKNGNERNTGAGMPEPGQGEAPRDYRERNARESSEKRTPGHQNDRRFRQVSSFHHAGPSPDPADRLFHLSLCNP